MTTVEFTIRNKNYSIACTEGEEARIAKLAENLAVRVDAMSQTFGSASDRVVLAITALMMEDEIDALQKQIASAQFSSFVPPVPAAVEGMSEEEKAEQINNALVNAIDPIAKYIETLANRIEKQ